MAAVDMKKLTTGDVKLDGSSVAIHLPPPAITSTVIDESQTRVWDREVRMWTLRPSFDILAGPGVRSYAIGWVDRQAEQSGLYAEAIRVAQSAIRSMLKGAGMDRVSFTDAAGLPEPRVPAAGLPVASAPVAK